MVQMEFTSLVLIFHANKFFQNCHFGNFSQTYVLSVWGQLIFMLVLEIEASNPLRNDLKSC